MRGMIPGVLLWAVLVGQAQADQLDIHGPPGSGRFGEAVKVLPNGNIVVADPSANFDRGAVYLYAPTGAQISVLSGGSNGDRAGMDRDSLAVPQRSLGQRKGVPLQGCGLRCRGEGLSACQDRPLQLRDWGSR